MKRRHSTPRVAHKNISFFSIFIAILFITVAALFSVWSKLEVIKLGYEISALEVEHRKLARENEKLELSLSRLKTPSRLEKIGREKLGLGPPDREQIIRLSKSHIRKMATK